jgi:hypothetical protein
VGQSTNHPRARIQTSNADLRAVGAGGIVTFLFIGALFFRQS